MNTCALLWALLACSSWQQVLSDSITRQELLQFEKTAETDYLLITSGTKCDRCAAVETVIATLLRSVQIPVFHLKEDSVQEPALELRHRVAAGHFQKIPYEGQRFTMSKILTFIQQKVFAPEVQWRQATSAEQAIAQSHSKGRVPFLATVSDSETQLPFYEKVANKASRLFAASYLDFWSLTADSVTPRLTVKHPNEKKLSNPSNDEAQLIQWIKTEAHPQFGPLRNFLRTNQTEDVHWLILVGPLSSFELFEHEFRAFAGGNRDHWRCGWVDKSEPDWAEQVYSVIGAHPLVQKCEPDCILGRKELVRQIDTADLSVGTLTKFTASLTPAAPSVEPSAEPLSRVADLRFEQPLVKRIEYKDFDRYIVQNYDALLLLLRKENDTRSETLRPIFVNIGKSLDGYTRLFEYILEAENEQLPDARYAAFTELPFIWLKPLGVSEDPVAIPWQRDLSEDSAPDSAEDGEEEPIPQRARAAVSQVVAKLRDLHHHSVRWLKRSLSSFLKGLLTSLNAEL